MIIRKVQPFKRFAGALSETYYPRMHWVHEHRFRIGVLADLLTFSGALLLARDASRRLRDLEAKRIDKEFHRTFPKLNLTNQDWRDALEAIHWTLAGFASFRIFA